MRATYSMRRIGEWDFRSWRSPLREDGSPYDDPVSMFLAEHFPQVLVVDHVRLHILAGMLDEGYGRLSADKEDVILTEAGEAVLPYLKTWRDAFTRMGRVNRRVVRSLVREQRANGRLRFSVLPTDLSKDFPALSYEEFDRRFPPAEKDGESG